MQENMTRNLRNVNQSDAKLECYIEEHCWHKMMGWCRAAMSEVSGMGLVKIVKGRFVVYQVFFPLQYGSSGYTELDDRAKAKLQIKLYNDKIPADHFRFWWHTHYNFNVFWSGTDDGNAETLAKLGIYAGKSESWGLSLVINQAAEFRCRADFYRRVSPLIPDVTHTLVDNMEVFTCKNSTRQRAKPHYKADVKKWVKPMSELPDKQKPKIEYCAPYDWRTAKDNDSTPTYPGQWDDNWWDKEDNDKKDACLYCLSMYCKNGYICGGEKTHKSTGSEDKKEGKRYAELQDGDKYADYIFYKGRLLSPSLYKQMLKDTTSDSREETVEEMAERVGEEYEKTQVACDCGQVDCKNYDLCIHCDICDKGRYRVSDGWCDYCWHLLEQESKGVKTDSAMSN